MQTQELLAYSVVGIFICNVVVLIVLVVTAVVVGKKLLVLMKGVEDIIQKAEGVMQTAQSVTTNAAEATRRISSSAASAQQIVGSVERAITPSLSLFAATQTTARASNLKMKLLGAGLGLAFRYFMQRRDNARHA